jgi:hypothetical protein
MGLLGPFHIGMVGPFRMECVGSFRMELFMSDLLHTLNLSVKSPSLSPPIPSFGDIGRVKGNFINETGHSHPLIT